MSGRPVHQHAFPAMGSTVEMTLVGCDRQVAGDAFALAESLANEWEETFSRFRPESELARLNASAGRKAAVSERLLNGIDAALRAAQETGWLFDPTVLADLLALGYDRSFEQIGRTRRQHRAGGQLKLPPDRSTRARANSVVLDRRTRTVTLAEGVGLDLGGIAKGLYVDELVELLAGWPGGSASAGGDLRLWGTPPCGEAWLVGVEDPDDARNDVALLTLQSGAVATSSANRRTWRHGGRQVHHLIDPRTGLPASSGVRSITVVAATAAAAEVAATALYVGGIDPPQVALLETPFITALAVRDSGEVQSIPGNVSRTPHAASTRAA